MDRFGFIHDKLDIKILILFVLSRLPEPLDGEALADLVLCDDGISYFDYADCLSELVDTGHVLELDHRYQITEKGIRNGSAIESSIPYSVRTKALQRIAPVASSMQRDAMIRTSHQTRGRDGCMVSLSLSDGVGEIASLALLVADEAQAEQIEQQFRANAESIYHKLIELFSK